MKKDILKEAEAIIDSLPIKESRSVALVPAKVDLADPLRRILNTVIVKEHSIHYNWMECKMPEDAQSTVYSAVLNVPSAAGAEELRTLSEQYEENIGSMMERHAADQFPGFSQANVTVSPILEMADGLNYYANLARHSNVRILTFRDEQFYVQDDGSHVEDELEMPFEEFENTVKESVGIKMLISVQFLE